MQVADVTSLRDIANGLRSATGNLNHLGKVKAPSKSTLSYQNKKRDYTIFMALYYALADKLEPSLDRKRKYAARLKRQIFIMDSSIIPLSLSLFDWALFRTKKGAIKLQNQKSKAFSIYNLTEIEYGNKVISYFLSCLFPHLTIYA